MAPTPPLWCTSWCPSTPLWVRCSSIRIVPLSNCVRHLPARLANKAPLQQFLLHLSHFMWIRIYMSFIQLQRVVLQRILIHVFHINSTFLACHLCAFQNGKSPLYLPQLSQKSTFPSLTIKLDIVASSSL